MKYLGLGLIMLLLLNCSKEPPLAFNTVDIMVISQDSTYSIRAIDVDEDEEYLYYGSSDHFGKLSLKREFKINPTELSISNNLEHKRFVFKLKDGKPLHFRALKQVEGHLFALSIESPARLYKLNRKAKEARLVYEESHPNAFYDAIHFWNNKEGIAIGDPTDDCMSIILTRDAGETWSKIPCSDLPKTREGEAAFAASNSNIAIVGDKVWVASGGLHSRIFHSKDKGENWEVIETPIIQGESTKGMYSLAFYDANNGFAIGGDYTKPNDTLNTKSPPKTVVKHGNHFLILQAIEAVLYMFPKVKLKSSLQ